MLPSSSTLLSLHTHALTHHASDTSCIHSLTHVIAYLSSTGKVDQAQSLLLWTVRVFLPETFDAVNKEMRAKGEITEEATKALKEIYDRGVESKAERDKRMRERLRTRLRDVLREEEEEGMKGAATRLCSPGQRDTVDQSG